MTTDRPVQSDPPNDGPWWAFIPCLVALVAIAIAVILVSKFLGVES